MGQRSQIYIRWFNENKPQLVAKYFQWNYSQFMVSRARALIEEIVAHGFEFPHLFGTSQYAKELGKRSEVNFDCRSIANSIDILDEFNQYGKGSNTTFNKFVFDDQDNNDGQLFIDIDVQKKIVKYAIRSNPYKPVILDAEQYMDWDYPMWRHELQGNYYQDTLDNIEFISKHAKLMTKREVNAFINYDYYPSF